MVFSKSVPNSTAFGQTPQEARQLLKYLDPNLGEPLDEKDYGGSCAIYDRWRLKGRLPAPLDEFSEYFHSQNIPHRLRLSEHPDPWHNLWDKVDIFILSHLLGYWCKVSLNFFVYGLIQS